MGFLGFYFGKKDTHKREGKCGVIYIKETEFNNLVEQFSKDYKYIIEAQEFKNNWGYGFKYNLEDSHLILLNKFKDEIDNDESLIYFNNETTFMDIQEDFKINCTNKQYTTLEEISL